jgi:hypothetical protein
MKLPLSGRSLVVDGVLQRRGAVLPGAAEVAMSKRLQYRVSKKQ